MLQRVILPFSRPVMNVLICNLSLEGLLRPASGTAEGQRGPPLRHFPQVLATAGGRVSRLHSWFYNELRETLQGALESGRRRSGASSFPLQVDDFGIGWERERLAFEVVVKEP